MTSTGEASHIADDGLVQTLGTWPRGGADLARRRPVVGGESRYLRRLGLPPVTLAGRLLAIVLPADSIVVFASLSATVGAFFIESRQERASTQGPDD